MKKITKEELQSILQNHKLWLKTNGEEGKKADLKYVNLENAVLESAYLGNLDLRNTNLINTNLRGAYLGNSDLRNTDLRDADLTNADLTDADLTDSKLNWTNTQDIRGQQIISVQVDTTRKNNKITYWKDLGIWTTGCFQGSLEELKESIEKTHKNNEFLRNRYYRVIDFILNECELEN